MKMNLATTGVCPGHNELFSFFRNIFSVAIESLKDGVLRFHKMFRKRLCCKVSVIYVASVATIEAALIKLLSVSG